MDSYTTIKQYETIDSSSFAIVDKVTNTDSRKSVGLEGQNLFEGLIVKQPNNGTEDYYSRRARSRQEPCLELHANRLIEGAKVVLVIGG